MGFPPAPAAVNGRAFKGAARRGSGSLATGDSCSSTHVPSETAQGRHLEDRSESTRALQTFENNSNAFDQSEGGLWSALFWNELRADGTAGTAANALIEGLQTQNTGEVYAATQVVVEQVAQGHRVVGRLLEGPLRLEAAGLEALLLGTPALACHSHFSP